MHLLMHGEGGFFAFLKFMPSRSHLGEGARMGTAMVLCFLFDFKGITRLGVFFAREVTARARGS